MLYILNKILKFEIIYDMTNNDQPNKIEIKMLTNNKSPCHFGSQIKISIKECITTY